MTRALAIEILKQMLHDIDSRPAGNDAAEIRDATRERMAVDFAIVELSNLDEREADHKHDADRR